MKIQLVKEESNVIITIDKGELISYKVTSIELMHQKDDKGWGSTEIEMFPIIGPTKDNDFLVETPKKDASLDQHGILRALSYELYIQENDKVVYRKNYKVGTLIPNPKFPNKSTLEYMSWPYDFEFFKTFELKEDSLTISFEIKSEKEMPYMLGFHPAFKVYNEDVKIVSNKTKLTLTDVLNVGAAAYLVNNSNQISLENNGSVGVTIETIGFDHVMLWTEVSNMICIEPITFYPYSVPSKELHKGFRKSTGNEKLEVKIIPVL
ncbi:aldose 1-epimerase [Aquimarina sp. 2201CG5-10]|uniref:aldose epimerase family protein n=1 Tax=Aquimarina callyspongiae TaxID=3098150 RepID=UPI002AB50CD7|nr:aldose 1-epimerase [Aquimarina sp. 2201CG5-10]MDY8136239.1 aldose 1-epimerase [Aquimarina sp. 2201CG5-10]